MDSGGGAFLFTRHPFNGLYSRRPLAADWKVVQSANRSMQSMQWRETKTPTYLDIWIIQLETPTSPPRPCPPIGVTQNHECHVPCTDVGSDSSAGFYKSPFLLQHVLSFFTPTLFIRQTRSSTHTDHCVPFTSACLSPGQSKGANAHDIGPIRVHHSRPLCLGIHEAHEPDAAKTSGGTVRAEPERDVS
jgi:hypothetical protein